MRQKSDAATIIDESIQAVLPDAAVRRALAGFTGEGGMIIVIAIGNNNYHTALACKTRERGMIIVIAIGKAAWRMAKAASDALGGRIRGASHNEV